MIEIYCNNYCYYLFFAGYDSRETPLKNYGYKVELLHSLAPYFIDLTVNGRNVRIIMSPEWMENCDVCIVGSWIHRANFIAEVKQQTCKCKQRFPEAPIIVVGNASLKNHPPRLKDLELAGQKLFNRKMSEELVRDVNAVKYVEYSWKSGQGLKILIDEIVFTYFSSLKVKEDRERMKKKADQVRRERAKRNLFIFEKFLDVLHYI